MGALLGAIAIAGLAVSLLMFRVELLTNQVIKGRETVEKLEKDQVAECKNRISTILFSSPLPITRELPVKEICGNFFWSEKNNCDSLFCDYYVLFGKFESSAVPVFSISKDVLYMHVEGENLDRLRRLADFLRSYQKSFPDHTAVNHFLDIGDTRGFQTLSAFSDFFEKFSVQYLDRYAQDLGTLSNFSICTSAGGDCDVDPTTPPFKCILKYTSPYTGKEVEILVVDK